MPDLTGRRVLLSGLGFTASPQPRLDTRLHDNVVALWKKIAENAGATCVTVNTNPNTENALAERPEVAVVTPPPPARFTCGATEIGERDDVGFLRGTARFRDPAAAEKTLRKLSGALADGRRTVELIGATSSEGSEADNRKLSELRAEEVRRVLVDQGPPRAGSPSKAGANTGRDT